MRIFKLDIHSTDHTKELGFISEPEGSDITYIVSGNFFEDTLKEILLSGTLSKCENLELNAKKFAAEDFNVKYISTVVDFTEANEEKAKLREKYNSPKPNWLVEKEEKMANPAYVAAIEKYNKEIKEIAEKIGYNILMSEMDLYRLGISDRDIPKLYKNGLHPVTCYVLVEV